MDYFDGRGVPRSFEEAASWCRKSAEQGYVLAQYQLGVMYAKGLGVLQDDAEAAAWYRKAAEQGHAAAQYNLGMAYYHGRGVTQDYGEAVTRTRKAAEQGHAEARQSLLGMLFLSVFVAEPQRGGFIDAGEGVLDSVKDLRTQLAAKGIRHAETRESAWVIITVLARGKGQAEYGQFAAAVPVGGGWIQGWSMPIPALLLGVRRASGGRLQQAVRRHYDGLEEPHTVERMCRGFGEERGGVAAGKRSDPEGASSEEVGRSGGGASRRESWSAAAWARRKPGAERGEPRQGSATVALRRPHP